MTETDSGRTGTVPVVAYAYPWDVIGNPAFADRARALGVTKVALAAAYHTTRAATPLHPEHRIVEARSAALYRPVRPEAWAGARLVPPAATWVAAGDPFGEAAAILAAAGIEVAAWIVLTHSTILGEANPDLAVLNCWGEPYPYALCARHEDVRRYAETLAAEAVRDTPVSAAILEACGHLGFGHGGHHEKTDGAYDEATQELLSICCCRACREDWTARGLDPEATVAALREATGAAPSGATVDPTALDAILASRHAAADELRHRVIAAVREAAPEITEIGLHAQPDPWATGASPGLTPTTADDVDLVVSFCWPTTAASVETGRRLIEAVSGKAAAAAYVTVLPPTTEDTFGVHVRALVDAGIDQIHLYHLGLAGADRQHLLAEATQVPTTAATRTE
ncbi:hypothetical protein SAMN05428985_105272 [Nocardioides sp. YR527]|uniref:hypothetical protein n=1 Tax=Nocardioides sp. YR527 TaxID=1881028 RepID=UPI00088D18AD|nr:hypothetical protein [Nocardioides sp. YR527]SDK68523.1 hypothetical protein SAMN05428985_105272 [Nocardioides sp. YR527]